MAETSDPAPPNSPAGPDSTRKPSASSPTTGSSHWFAWLALALVVGLASAFVWRRSESRQTAAPGTPPPVPVVVARAEKGDIGDYVTGLGTVTPINTVEVRTRVDGQLMTVAYREGQMVRQGAPLVEIDPRPFQVQLEQAEAQLAQGSGGPPERADRPGALRIADREERRRSADAADTTRRPSPRTRRRSKPIRRPSTAQS